MSESEEHTAVIRLANAFPEVVRSLLIKLGTPPPPNARVEAAPTNVSFLAVPGDPVVETKARHTDNAVLFVVGEEWKQCAVLEYQRRHSRDKIFRWLQYAVQVLERTNLDRPREKGVCPSKLLVVTPDESTIRLGNEAYDELAQAHKDIGQELSFRPVFVGPEQLPEITDAAVAQADPPLAVLTAVVHPQSLQAAQLALNAALAAALTGHQRNIIFAILCHCIAPEYVEELKKMSVEFEKYTGSWSDQKLEEGRAQGMKEGELTALRRVVSLQLKRWFPEQLKDATVAARFEGADADQLLRVAQVLGPAVTTWDQVEQALSG